MSFLKAAIAVAAVAGVGYVGYKACKSKTVRKIAVAVATAPSQRSTPYRRPEPVAPVEVTVTEVVTEVKADKRNMGGVMGVAATVQQAPITTTTVVDPAKRRVDVTVERVVAKPLKPLSDKDLDRKFGFEDSAIPR